MKLKQSLKSAKKKVEEDAMLLQNMRQQAAKQFEKDIKKELDDLYLPHAAFKVHFEKAAYTKAGGYDVIFMIRMNTGQSFAPLNESASGGELSRLMLAIKTVTLKHSSLMLLALRWNSLHRKSRLSVLPIFHRLQYMHPIISLFLNRIKMDRLIQIRNFLMKKNVSMKLRQCFLVIILQKKRWIMRVHY